MIWSYTIAGAKRNLPSLLLLSLFPKGEREQNAVIAVSAVVQKLLFASSRLRGKNLDLDNI
jgi:hypothetical protein